MELKVVHKTKFCGIARCARLGLGALALVTGFVSAQSSAPGPIPASTPELGRADAPSTRASAEDLERRADQLRAAKAYLEALDYYQSALSQKPNSAVLYNKLGINELLSARYQQAQKDFERATKLDAGYADAFNNLGVLEYLHRRYGRAIKQYQRAIAFDSDEASYYGNLGMAYFAKKEWERSIDAYGRAVSLDPSFFGRTSNGGVAGRISSPGDRAHFSYVLAKLYAKNGLTERSLEYLRRAIEEGYKIDGVYKDPDFTALRQNPRFLELMAARPVSIPQ
jgi:tetratricopeptide (TPR) repeat protein